MRKQLIILYGIFMSLTAIGQPYVSQVWVADQGDSTYINPILHADYPDPDVCVAENFHPDYTSYHVAVYDTISGNFIKGVTHQGYQDETMWARGQAWGIYGYTFIYRETGDPKLLHSTGHWPAGSEIDASIIYADYYYIEALLRLNRVYEGKPVIM